MFHWHSSQHESFLALKEGLTTAAILAYPDFSIPLQCILTLVEVVLDLTLLRYSMVKKEPFGENFSETEKKYSITEREALSVIVAIQKCKPYLLGSHFIVVVDHQALKWLISLRDPTGRLAWWALTLQGYDFAIQNRPEKDHGNADALSRRVYTISQQPMLPQTSTEELRNAQNDKLQPLN